MIKLINLVRGDSNVKCSLIPSTSIHLLSSPLHQKSVNTTSRIETTGARNRIHVSEELATILKMSGKEHWVQPRADVVSAKGKGTLKTFWLTAAGCATADTRSSAPTLVESSTGDIEHVSSLEDTRDSTNKDLSDYDAEHDSGLEAKSNHSGKQLSEGHARLVTWVTKVLAKFLKQSEARRSGLHGQGRQISKAERAELEELEHKSRTRGIIGDSGLIIDEVQDSIKLPRVNVGKVPTSADLDACVISELHDYVETVAKMYNANVSSSRRVENFIAQSMLN